MIKYVLHMTESSRALFDYIFCQTQANLEYLYRPDYSAIHVWYPLLDRRLAAFVRKGVLTPVVYGRLTLYKLTSEAMAAGEYLAVKSRPYRRKT